MAYSSFWELCTHLIARGEFYMDAFFEGLLVSLRHSHLAQAPKQPFIHCCFTIAKEFESEISSRQSEVDRLTKPKRRAGDRSGAATPTGRRSSTGTPSGRR